LVTVQERCADKAEQEWDKTDAHDPQLALGFGLLVVDVLPDHLSSAPSGLGACDIDPTCSEKGVVNLAVKPLREPGLWARRIHAVNGGCRLVR
jgi:hypothetical protein